MDEQWMHQALALAREAFDHGEVPVGCVIVQDGQLVGYGRNRREEEKNALYHAELEAINMACRSLGGWRLWRACLYVTLEPCCMCAGAIVNARIPRVVYGARDEKNGALSSAVNLFALPQSFRPEAVGGVLQDECGGILQAFFQRLRSAPPKVQHWRQGGVDSEDGKH